MKQPEDDKTIDMLGPGKAKPGRPAKKDKLTAAKRQEARRERLRAAGKGFINAAIDLDIIERIDALRVARSANKDDIIATLLRQALGMPTPPAQGAESGNAAS